MPGQQQKVEAVREISVDPQPGGPGAVYLVETLSQDQTREVAKLFSELSHSARVRQLSKGRLVSYAVQVDDPDSTVLDEIEVVLKSNYGFVVMQRSLDEVIYQIVEELCNDTDSKLLPVPKCNICGKTEAFPNTVVRLSAEDGSVLLNRNYCARCTAEAVAPNNKQFVRSLLAADRRDFRRLERAQMTRRRTRNQPIRFRIESPGQQRLARTG